MICMLVILVWPLALLLNNMQCGYVFEIWKPSPYVLSELIQWVQDHKVGTPFGFHWRGTSLAGHLHLTYLDDSVFCLSPSIYSSHSSGPHSGYFVVCFNSIGFPTSSDLLTPGSSLQTPGSTLSPFEESALSTGRQQTWLCWASRRLLLALPQQPAVSSFSRSQEADGSLQPLQASTLLTVHEMDRRSDFAFLAHRVLSHDLRIPLLSLIFCQISLVRKGLSWHNHLTDRFAFISTYGSLWIHWPLFCCGVSCQVRWAWWPPSVFCTDYTPPFSCFLHGFISNASFLLAGF